jgi:hypothetical protein
VTFHPKTIHEECVILINMGLSPVAIVMYARMLNFSSLLLKCFPRMPASTVDSLMTGKASLLLDEYMQWRIAYAETA